MSLIETLAPHKSARECNRIEVACDKANQMPMVG